MRTVACRVPFALSSLLLAALAVPLAPGPAVAAKGDCGQPSSLGAGPTSSDALAILKEAVGQQTVCEDKPCVCDVNSSGSTNTSDALLCLKKAVGQSVDLTCPCDAPPADDFNDNSVDRNRWGTDIIENNGELRETAGRLEYRASPDTISDYALRPWIGGVLPYGSDWQVQIDVTNESFATADDQVTSYGLSVVDLSNYDNEVYWELYMSRAEGPPTRYGFYGELSGTGGDGWIDSGGYTDLTRGAVRIAYTASNKVMTLLYDIDPSNGYAWVTLGSFGVAGSGGADGNGNWGMGSGDRFGVGVYGYSSFIEVPAGKMYGDNFGLVGGVEP